MNDEVVDVVHLEVLERLHEVWFDVLLAVVAVPQLALDEQILALDDAVGDALGDGGANLVLVVVVVGGVDVAVAGLDGSDDSFCRLARAWGLPSDGTGAGCARVRKDAQIRRCVSGVGRNNTVAPAKEAGRHTCTGMWSAATARWHRLTCRRAGCRPVAGPLQRITYVPKANWGIS